MFFLLHDAGMLYGLGFTILICVLVVGLFGALASREKKVVTRSLRKIRGINRAERRAELARSRKARKNR